MQLLNRMLDYSSVASWAVWQTDAAGELTREIGFPLSAPREAVHGRAMFVSLNPGSDRVHESAEVTPPWSNFHHPDPKHHDQFLAAALVRTPVWGFYMTDLHSAIAESDSRKLATTDDEKRAAVESLIEQAQLLGEVKQVVAVGERTRESLRRHWALIEQRLGLSPDALLRIPHYSGANAAVHGNRPESYAQLVHAALGIG